MFRTSVFVMSFTAACLAAGEAQAAQLTASWVDNASGEATTRIERRPANVVAFAALADVPPSVTEYVDTSVSPGSKYCYRVLAHNADGVSPYSDEACATAGNDGSLQLAVSHAGDGLGTVASTPVGIECGTACAAAYNSGTVVTLTATPNASSTFTGWSGGGCAGTGSCILAGNAAVSVTATFVKQVNSFLIGQAVAVPGSPAPGKGQ